MAGIKDYSTTQANNTSLNSINVGEGMLPSNLNNAIRALMKNTREWFNDSQWVEYGDGDGAYTAAYASATSFTIAGVDVSAIYHEGRRIKLIAPTPGTIYGTISSSSFSTNTTINVTWDSGSLSNEAITNVYIGALSKTNNSLPTGVIATATLADGSVTTVKIADSAVTTAKINDAAVTNAKLGADSVNGSKIADDSIDSEHYVDGSIDTAHIADSQITTAKIADSNITTAKIADSNVTTAKLASNAVTTVKITDSNVTTAKIAADAIDGTKIADDSINSEHYVDGSIDTAHIADSQITTAKIADSNVTTAKIADSNVTTAKINDDAVTAAKIADAVIVTNSEQSTHTPDDVTFFTTSASDGRYFRQDSSETIDSGDTWSGSDAFIATTAAIDARVIDLVDDVGGFFPIANETSFPNTNPDINDGAGTIVSIKEIATTRTPSGGTVTISGGTVGGSTVTITGCGSTVLTAGFGVLVETTTTLNTYTFHRLVPKATEVTTVASISSDITTVANDGTDIGVVAGLSSDIQALADIEDGTTATNAISNVGNNISSVTTTASNITGVNSFAERYRVSSSAPTTSLDTGDLYFDTTVNELKVYGSSGWQAAGSSVNGTSQRYNYTATSGQTTFTGSDNAGNTLTYDSPYIDVYLNGIKLLNGTDVTVTSGSSVVLASGATTGDVIDIVAYGTFSVSSLNADNLDSGTVPDARITGAYTGITNLTITTTDNSDTLTLKSTDADANAAPILVLARDSGSPADNDQIGRVIFKGDDDAGNVTNFFTVDTRIADASNGSEDFKTVFSGMVAGTERHVFTLGSTEAVFNDGSQDIDFRVESNGNANMLFVDAGNDRVGVGTSSPSQLLHVNGHIVGNSLNIPSNTGSPPSGVTIHKPADNTMAFRTDSAERMRIDSSGNLLVDKTSTNYQTVGHELRDGGRAFHTADGGKALSLNRLTSNGAIVDFYRFGTEIGNIGTAGSGSIYFAEATYGGLAFSTVAAGDITPCNSDGSARDNVMSLGQPTARFKDAYLSQGVYLGGTGTANKLDDYEEGTWTPADTSGAGLSITLSGQAKYVKIGNLVFFTASQISYPSTSNGSAARLGGLPFTNTGANTGTQNLVTSNTNASKGLVIANDTYMHFYATSSTAAATNAQLSNVTIYGISGVYSI